MVRQGYKIIAMEDPQRNLEIIFSAIDELRKPVALAISGGGDSMAMMQLFAEWRKDHPLGMRDDGAGGKKPVQDVVCSVDHGLRDEAADEVTMVISEAERLGFKAVGLRIESLEEVVKSVQVSPGDLDIASGVKGAGQAVVNDQIGAVDIKSVQARAREARYFLMAEAMAGEGITHLLTAHTMDDQAETFLMRLKRASGVDGLSSILPVREIFGITLMRPLLGVRGASLRHYLMKREIKWIEDPSNQNDYYERIQVRRLFDGLDGDGHLRSHIAHSAARLQRSRYALEGVAVDFIKTHVEVLPWGILRMDALEFDKLHAEFQVRVLRRVLGAFGQLVRGLSGLEDGAAHLNNMGSEKFAMAGVICEKQRAANISFSRESGRTALEEIDVCFGGVSEAEPIGAAIAIKKTVIWDKRVRLEFVPVRNVSGESKIVKVRGFTTEEARRVTKFYRDEYSLSLNKLMGLNEGVICGLASCWVGEELIAVPQLSLEHQRRFLKALKKAEGSGQNSGGVSWWGLGLSGGAEKGKQVRDDNLSLAGNMVEANFPLSGWDEYMLEGGKIF